MKDNRQQWLLRPSNHISEVNEQITQFSEQFKIFFRREQRSDLQAQLFDVPGRLVLGCLCDYDNLDRVWRMALSRLKLAATVRLMKRFCGAPNLFHVTCLVVSYLIGREQHRLADPARFREPPLEEISFILSTGKRLMQGARSDRQQFSPPPQGPMPILTESMTQYLRRGLEPARPRAREIIRRFMATVTAYSFLFHGEMRDGIFNHGPYRIPDGFLVIKEITDMKNDLFPWGTLARRLPFSDIMHVMAVRQGRAEFDVLGGLHWVDTDIEKELIAEGVFNVDSEKIRPIPISELAEMQKVVEEIQTNLYLHFVEWPPSMRTEYGWLLHANFLRGFWRGLPDEAWLRQYIYDRYRTSGAKYLALISEMRKNAWVLEHIAKTAGNIFSHYGASEGRCA
ncbi:MAG: hypothetical protein HY314_00030 [Acidobacteria bacterium]|nr:hypothetical protein [Acidobacteriota bacterium]